MRVAPSYYRARYYDPSVARFLSEDPIGLNGGPNLYAYVRNSPTGNIDPSGEIIVVDGDVNLWLQAQIYLCASPAACSILSELGESKNIYILHISDQIALDEAGGWDIYWNPHQAMCVKAGVQSPAIQLLHEMVHLWQWKHDVPRDEEQAVSVTNPAAKQLGEPRRLNYHDSKGSSTWPIPFPSSPKDRCECQEPRK